MRQWVVSRRRDAASGRGLAHLAISGGRGSCLGLRTGVSPHFSTNSKREMLADHERGAASPPSSPMPDFWGCTLTRPRSHTDCARPSHRTISTEIDAIRSLPISPRRCYGCAISHYACNSK